MRAEPVLDVVQAGAVEVRHRSDRQMPIGLAAEQPFEQFVLDEAIRLIVALPFLVLNDPALFVEHISSNRTKQMPHPVAFEEQRAIERGGRHILEIIGAIEAGGAVIVGRADLLQRLEEIARRILAAVEHQMLEEVREAGLPRGLVLRADVVPDAHRNDRRLAVGVHDDAQPVGEGEGLERNVDCAGERGGGDGRGLGD